MAKKSNYMITRDNNSKEITFLEFESQAEKGYKVFPKRQKQELINVTKMVFVSPSLTEKILKKKINLKIEYLLKRLNIIEEDNDPTSDGIKEVLNEAERIKLMMINMYRAYLKDEFLSLSLKKIQIIINELRVKLYLIREKKVFDEYADDYNKGGKSR